MIPGGWQTRAGAAPYLPIGTLAPARLTGQCACVDSTEQLRRIVRGEESFRELERLGVQLSSDARELRSPPIPASEIPLADLAIGFIAYWARGTDLREWASVMLMMADIQFIEAESSDEDAVLEAVWTASAGEDVDDSTLAVVQRIASA